MQQLAANVLITMREYPPSQTPGSFNLDKVQKMIEAGMSGS
jgi:arylsulfatase